MILVNLGTDLLSPHTGYKKQPQLEVRRRHKGIADMRLSYLWPFAVAGNISSHEMMVKKICG